MLAVDIVMGQTPPDCCIRGPNGSKCILVENEGVDRAFVIGRPPGHHAGSHGYEDRV